MVLKIVSYDVHYQTLLIIWILKKQKTKNASRTEERSQKYEKTWARGIAAC